MTTLEISPVLGDAAHRSVPDRRRERMLTLYAQDRLSRGPAREFVGLTRWEFRPGLALRRIKPHDDIAEGGDDLTPWRERGRLS